MKRPSILEERFMKNVVLLIVTLATLALGACNRDNGSSNNNNVAAVPANTYVNGYGGQACGGAVPSSWCVAYDPNRYGNYPYGTSSYMYYGNYGYGWYNAYGYYMPNYSGYGYYGCPRGYQPMYTGSGWYTYGNTGYICMRINVMSNYYYNYGYIPYYPTNYTWYNNIQGGYGPAQACDAMAQNCGGGAYCQSLNGSRFGYCGYYQPGASSPAYFKAKTGTTTKTTSTGTTRTVAK